MSIKQYKSYEIRFVIREPELQALKKALGNYPKNKSIMTDLLGLIEYQERKQSAENEK